MKTQMKTAIVFLVLSLVFVVPSVFASEQCPSDVNGDGMVDPLDSGALMARYCDAGNCDAGNLAVYDLDADGGINSLDTYIVTTNFGSCSEETVATSQTTNFAVATACFGDLNGDGMVDPLDSGAVQARFGSTDSSDLSIYDLNGDGAINELDSSMVSTNFGECFSEEDTKTTAESPSVIFDAKTENSFESEKETKKTVERTKVAKNKTSSLEVSKNKTKRPVVFYKSVNLNAAKIRLN